MLNNVRNLNAQSFYHLLRKTNRKTRFAELKYLYYSQEKFL